MILLRHLNFGVSKILNDGRSVTEFVSADPSQWGQFVPSLDFFSPELIKFLELEGLVPDWWEIFYSPPGWANVIHIDSPDRTPLGKLNWVVGETDSSLHWYRELPSSSPQARTSEVETSYIRFNPEDVDLVAVTRVSGWPSLLESGLQPHQSVNSGAKPRWCVTMAFRGQNGKMLSFKELYDRLGKYEIR